MLSKAKRLLEKIEQANQRYGLIRRGDRLLIAVSGGPDSTALLYLLALLQKKHNLSLKAAHLNHRISSFASKYVKNVRKHAEFLQVPLVVEEINVRQRAKREKRSLEEAGRLARYSFFEKLAKRWKGCKIVTAHTLDDQAETVLMRLFRGAGIRGLAGVLPKRLEGQIEVIRPLILLEKKELLLFLKANKIDFCEDPTNSNHEFMRNRVRHDFLPRLKTYNPQIKFALANLAGVCADAQEFLMREAASAFKKLNTQKAGKSQIVSLSKLEKLHPYVLKEVFLKCISQVQSDTKRITNEHLEAIAKIQRSNENSLEVHLPSMQVKKTASKLIFRRY